MSLALHYWMGDAHHCSGPPVSEMTYTVLSGTLNPSIPYHSLPWVVTRTSRCHQRATHLRLFDVHGAWHVSFTASWMTSKPAACQLIKAAASIIAASCSSPGAHVYRAAIGRIALLMIGQDGSTCRRKMAVGRASIIHLYTGLSQT